MWSEKFPNFSVIDEETALIKELEVDSDDLFEDVRNVAGGGVIDAIFDLVKKGFDRLIDIIEGAKNCVVFLDIRGGDVDVGCVQVIQYGAGGGAAIPTYLCRRERMNSLSTVERRICQRALSVQSYLLKSAEPVSKE